MVFGLEMDPLNLLAGPGLSCPGPPQPYLPTLRPNTHIHNLTLKITHLSVQRLVIPGYYHK